MDQQPVPVRTRRMVVKVGSSSLTNQDGHLAVEKLIPLVKQLAHLHRLDGWQVILVSSGAIAAGLGQLGGTRATTTLPQKQAAAAVGQTLLMEQYEHLFHKEQLLVGQVLLTRLDVEDRKRFIHIRNTLHSLLEYGVVPIVNENDTVAVDEIRFGDNDTLASLVALVAEANLLVLLTDIDGVYTENPRHNPHATRLADIWEITDDIERLAGPAGSSVGTGGMRTKVSAAKIAMESGADVVIAASDHVDVLLRIAAGEKVGTTFHAIPNRTALRKSWLRHGTQAEGCLHVDAGAVGSLMDHSGSLLFPGITEVDGNFDVGAVVELCSPSGIVFGKGLIAYSARDLAELLGKKRSGEMIRNIHEVVHRNDMVFLQEELTHDM